MRNLAHIIWLFWQHSDINALFPLISSFLSTGCKTPILHLTPILLLSLTKMLYLIGLGLGDAKDITVKGLEVVQQCSRVYLEAYTSILTVGKEALVGDYRGKEFCFKALINKFKLRNLPQHYKKMVIERHLV